MMIDNYGLRDATKMTGLGLTSFFHDKVGFHLSLKLILARIQVWDMRKIRTTK